jgi:hypothetical protein
MTQDVELHAGRRRLLAVAAAGLAAAPIARLALAQNAEKVDEASPQAKALDYHHDAAQVKNPKRTSDQFCHNCQFFQGKQADAWAPCTVFQGKLVANKGWCSTWVKKA